MCFIISKQIFRTTLLIHFEEATLFKHYAIFFQHICEGPHNVLESNIALILHFIDAINFLAYRYSVFLTI